MRYTHTTVIILVLGFILVACSYSHIPKLQKQLFTYDENLKQAHIGISIYDPANNTFLYQQNSNDFFIPGSTVKLFTAYSVIKNTGDSLPTFHYTIEDSTCYLYPTGDPTFLHPLFDSKKATALLSNKNIVLCLTDTITAYAPGWSWDDYEESYMAERSAMPVYGNIAKVTAVNNQFLFTPSLLKKNVTDYREGTSGFSINKKIGCNEFTITSGKQTQQKIPFTITDSILQQLLADTLHALVRINRKQKIKNNTTNLFFSQPGDSVLKYMLHNSDNFMAEQLLLLVGQQKSKHMNEKIAIDSILHSDCNFLKDNVRWVDGSGLSRYNLFTPLQFIALLNRMKAEISEDRLYDLLPTGGKGTLKSLFKEEENRIFAKSGSMSGVYCLSGYLITDKKRKLHFSVMINGFIAPLETARRATEKFIKAIIHRY